MNCSCIINNEFLFTIDYKKDHLLFIDKSKWKTNEYNTPITTHELTIKNGSLEKKININLNNTTIIKYSDLPTKSGTSKDGVYTFILDNCGKLYSQCEAILPESMCKYSKYLLNTNEENHKETLWKIYSTIEYIKANSNLCLEEKAQKHYENLQNIFKQLNCSC